MGICKDTVGLKRACNIIAEHQYKTWRKKEL